jgi:hypothetical protein
MSNLKNKVVTYSIIGFGNIGQAIDSAGMRQRLCALASCALLNAGG